MNMGINPDIAEMERFLALLGKESLVETTSKLSMYAIGEKMGLDRERAGRIAEEIIAQGWAEIQTLAGDIGITTAGSAHLAEIATSGGEARPSLGSHPFLDESKTAYLDALITELKVALGQAGIEYDTLAEVVADLRSLEAQMVSPRIKTDIVRILLEDIVQCLTEKIPGQLIPRLKAYII
jgi:hypothetical protein